MPNLAWIRKGYHGYSACMTDNAASARANMKFLQVFYIVQSHERMYSTKQLDHEASYLAISASRLPSVRYGQSKVIASGPITCWESGCAG
jgi:hypothetical protein